MWILPTRNRPDAVKRFIASMRATGDVPEVAVMIDGDPEPYKDVDWPFNWHIHVAAEHLELQKAFNSVLTLYPGRKWYGTMVDHCEFISPDWSRKLIEAAGDWNIAFCEDEYRTNLRTGFPRQNAVTCLGGKLVQALGYVYPDFCVHLAGDDALEEIGWELGIVRTPPDTLIKALFFIKGEFGRDDNHNRIYQGKSYIRSDMENFFDWRQKEKPKLLSKLNALIPKAFKDEPRIPLDAKPLTFCCIQTNNYCGKGAEYVNLLHDMIKRNLPYGFRGKFICFTDDSTGLNAGIDARPLPVPGLEGWWNKIALFKKGVFDAGEQVWYFDLDTLVIGPLDEIVTYKGNFATLKDFYHPQQVGPGIISWKVNETNCSIWEEWDSQGRPQKGLGDLWWINSLDQGRFAKKADKLQTLFPDRFVSYKVNCIPYPPKGASVVCFHGQPKCHNTDVKWVENVWKIDGMMSAEVKTFCNTPDTQLKKNIAYSSSLDIPWLKEIPAHKGTAVLVGGAPSLLDSLEEIKGRQKSGQVIFALNNTAKVLSEKGIHADYQIIMDARKENVAFVKGSKAKTFVLASQVAREVFDEVSGREILLFHSSIPGLRDILPEKKRDTILVGGGTTVLTRAMALVHFMGYRYQHLYGVDSSFRGLQHHAYDQSINSDQPSDVFVNGQEFKSCPWMLAQVDEFQVVSSALADEGAAITVHGDGLLPYVAKCMMAA